MFDLDPTSPNIFPSQYRQVSVSLDAPSLDANALEQHFVGRDAYMRTRFIVCKVDNEVALVEVATEDSEALFSPILGLRVLVGPDECVYLDQPDIDVGIASQIAPLAADHPDTRCLIVEGRYSHVSFLLNAVPLRISVLDIVPPAPSKLADQAQRVLDVAEDLPPLALVTEPVSSLDLLHTERSDAEHVLMPCRTTGVELRESAKVSYLDQRPEREDWTLLGCQRSEQIHQAFYADAPPRVDTCPRRFLDAERDAAGPTLTRCCLLQEGQEVRQRTVLVPWGSSLLQVRQALESLIDVEGFEWTPT